jgi:pyridoxamine 5'-phosphate oxidase|tara:strand:- start:444 stop:1067 length:624 start_codon:yes stop_codon:yes gene_type:complete
MNQKSSFGLNECFLDVDNPIELFKIWLEKAKKHEISDPDALSLATSDKRGNPSIRMVLLKNVSEKGFIFYTNLNSKKSLNIEENPKAAMCFYWKSLRRQIIVIGSINQVDDVIADKYFNSRDYESKIGAWASDQSETLNNKNDLLKKIEEYKKKYSDTKNLPRPKHWSGWNLMPSSIEFWLHGKNRIHERLKYNKVNNEWQKTLLNP